MDRLTVMLAFVRLVELGTFSAVADELRVKQSTVSKWVAGLEEELGTQLVERTTRTRRITDAGQQFYAKAREILAAYDALVAELQEDTPELQGRLRVSVPVVFGRKFVVPHVAAFLKEHHKVELELVLSDRYVNLIEERFDVAIRVGRAVDSSLRSKKLGETGRVLVASPEYIGQHTAPLTPRALSDHACLLHTGLSTGATWVFYETDAVSGERKKHRASVRGRFSANNSEALLEMACEGLGVALLAQWLVEAELACGRLVPLLKAFATPSAPIHALMPPTQHVHPRVRSFLDFMGGVLAQEFAAFKGEPDDQ